METIPCDLAYYATVYLENVQTSLLKRIRVCLESSYPPACHLPMLSSACVAFTVLVLRGALRPAIFIQLFSFVHDRLTSTLEYDHQAYL